MMKGFKAAGCDYAARAACVCNSLFISAHPVGNSFSLPHSRTHFWHWCRYELTIKGCIFWEFTLVLLSCNRGSEQGTWEGKTMLWCLFPPVLFVLVSVVGIRLTTSERIVLCGFCWLGSLFLSLHVSVRQSLLANKFCNCIDSHFSIAGFIV